jgi:hypothetical protein
MKIKYKEDWRAWRKNALFSAVGIFLFSSLLRWRHVLSTRAWSAVLILMVMVAVIAFLRPQWLRGYYRFSTWAGFWSSQAVAWLVLVFMFGALIVPAATILRLLGKDPLHLKRSPQTSTYWQPAKPSGSLDRLF